MNNRNQGGRPAPGRSFSQPRQNAGGYKGTGNQPNNPPPPSTTHYPFTHELAEAVLDGIGQPKSSTFNFGLWHQKLAPFCRDNKDQGKIKAYKGTSDNAHVYYKNGYTKVKGGAKDALRKLREKQTALISHPMPGLLGVEIEAKLISPLLTGIGAPHLSETNLYLDRNLGIPAIPASSVKGIVRLGHILEMLGKQPDLAQKEWVKDYEIDLLPELFGIASEDAVKQKKNEHNRDADHKWGRGRVVFLDAYPKEVPDLKADILNPHYPKYYREGEKEWPRDNQDPIPVTFLTVAPGTVFCFRFLAPNDLLEPLKAAVTRILTQEGVGAKTSLGYGRFKLVNVKDYDPEKMAVQEKTRQEGEEAVAREKAQKEAALRREGILRELRVLKDNPGAQIDHIIKIINDNALLKTDKILEAQCREWFKPKLNKKKSDWNSQFKAMANLFGWEIPEVPKP